MRIYAFLFMSLILKICLSLAPSAVKASDRVALVVGNAEYQIESLKTPANDAQDMRAALTKIGFEVTTLTNADRRELLEGLNTFADKLKNAEVGLFYYAGYAVQVDGVNYLLPLKAAMQSAADIEYEAVQLSLILDKMGESKNQLNIVVLDACRANPLSSFLTNPSQGLAPVEVPPDMIVSYAATPGSIADEGTGKNSVFTKHLISSLKGQELTVQGWINTAGDGVLQETSQQQKTWIKSSRDDLVYLVGEPPPEIESTPQPTSSSEKTAAIERGPGSTAQRGRLEVTVWPRDAKIRMLNIGPKYQSGMKLPAGRYQVEVSRTGYKTLKQWVEIASEEHAEYDLQLEENYPGSGVQKSISKANQNKVSKNKEGGAAQWAWLEVIPDPSDAKIRVLNIVPKYKPGMKLSSGRYHLEVSKDGYNIQKKWIELAPGEYGTFNVELAREQSGSVPKPSFVKNSKLVDPNSPAGISGMDKSDKRRLDDIFEYGVSGQKSSWVNAKSGADFQVIPQKPFSNRLNNKTCRIADIVATIDGVSHNTKITACLNSRGEWDID